MSALQARARLEVDGARFEYDELRRDIERLRAFVELRAQAQENLVRAMLAESTARAAEALESRIQLAAREAMAFAEHGLEQHETTLRALARRVAEVAHVPAPEPETESVVAAPVAGAYWIGAGAAEARDCRRLDIRDDSEDAFLADLSHLPILPGGAATLVAAHVVEFVALPALRRTILPHWRSRLAPGGELVVITLDGPRWAADLARAGADFPGFRERMGADGTARPPRTLFDADALRQLLGEAGLTAQPPAGSPSLELRMVARAASA